MKYFLIFNPGAKCQKNKNSLVKIQDFFENENIPYEVRTTTCLHDATRFSKEANLAGFDVVVAIGGDGTINRVIQGFYDDYGNRLSNAKMGVIYTGTSPDFCKSYCIPIKPRKALEELVNGKTLRINIGQVKSLSDPGGQTQYFACALNIGIGPFLAEQANNGIRGVFGDFCGTFLSLLKILFSYKPQRYLILIDGVPYVKTGVFNITIGRTFHIASGIKIQHDLTLDDDRFFLFCLSDLNRKNILSALIHLYTGKKIPDCEWCSIRYGSEITIKAEDSSARFEFDGDPGRMLPCEIKMANDKLDLIVKH